MQNLEPGQIWFVRSISSDSPEVDIVEIEYLNGNVVGFGEAYYDLRLLDFVGRDYEREEQREQERFLESLTPVKEETEEVFEQVPETPTKLSWWARIKLWWVSHDYHY